MIFIGIDPGLNGALAHINDVGNFATVQPVQTITRAKGNSFKREYNVAAMIGFLNEIENKFVHTFCTIEAVHAMPGQGVTSMFSMGYGFGLWVGILTSLRIPFQFVTPQAWKKAMLYGTGKDKEASRLKAIQLFPQVADQLALKKDEGKAEALLIAEYGRRLYRGQKT